MTNTTVKNTTKKKKLLIGITGASGMLFLPPFLEMIDNCSADIAVHGICSESGVQVLQHELQLEPHELPAVAKWFDIDDFSAPPSSGSSGYNAMVILPCTMGSLAAIAGGHSFNLIHRAADVMLKERKQLILAVRETPLNRNHLSNMLQAHDAGAMIFPPMPGFYLRPKTLEEAAQTYCWRLADALGIEVKKRKRWGGETDV